MMARSGKMQGPQDGWPRNLFLGLSGNLEREKPREPT